MGYAALFFFFFFLSLGQLCVGGCSTANLSEAFSPQMCFSFVASTLLDDDSLLLITALALDVNI